MLPAHIGFAAAMLVSPQWLSQHLDDRDLVILQVGDKREFDAEHIPGARYVAESDLVLSRVTRGDLTLSAELPPADELKAKLESLGISDRSRIVVSYATGPGMPMGARIVLTLDHLGLGDRASLLDGGLAGWKAAGNPVTTNVAAIAPGHLSPVQQRPFVVDVDWVRAHLGSSTTHIIDARSPVFYDGVEATSTRKGHIASATSLPYSEVTDARGNLKSASELAALFAKAGVRSPRDTVVAYCHIGWQANAVLLAARTLGYPALLYDGSFQEWTNRTDLPVEPTEQKP